ncbi:MAG: LemA family protein [Pseudomonadota bacterium]|nr:LemA family protein [Pseudomonadota bacterium]
MALILLPILFILVTYTISLYNRGINLIEAVHNNQKQIDIQLDRRFKVFESLVDVVRKYMDFEKSTLKAIVALRQQAVQAGKQGDMASKIAYENTISKMLGDIKVVFEQYPSLQSSQNALQLQEEIVSTENKLSFAKQALNDSIEIYNIYKKCFPSVLVVTYFSKTLDKTFTYWELTQEQVQTQESYTVKL